ncbi:ATP-binding protein [Oceanobacillus senegalensis]|uniref:ATP-binding protein n=1 Tax=Oceanobacillus senegalensis TaxID=1936063 RepID=UPI001FEC3102|nr:ATP-binding protein [Oceanobacillus senegalensis]
MSFENVKSDNKVDSSQTVPGRSVDEGYFSNYSMLPLPILDWIENNQNEVIEVCDEKGKIIFVSNSAERLIGYTRSELVGTFWYDRFTLEERNYIEKNHEDTYNKNQRFTVDLIHKSGERMTTDIVTNKVFDEYTQKSYYVITLRDISDRKETEELLVRSEKMSVAGQLAAGIAHEIRNPLTSIKGFLQLLQAGVDRKEEYYKIMIEEIEKMEKITSELLFVSKPLTDFKRLESIKEMIDDTVSLLHSQAKLKNIGLIIQEPITANIHCDKSQIKQVLINMVKNAIEAMDKPGEITIRVLSNTSSIEIHIMDEGPGIPEDILHKLGEPFFTTKKNGTGLGIMISKQILEEHHGRLEIIQKENNQGSIFKLIFPKPDSEKHL